MKNYNKVILQHYKMVALKMGNSDNSTMDNVYVRKKETKIILKAIRQIISIKKSQNLNLLEIGCGDGYTLSRINEKFPKLSLIGLEYTPELKVIAETRHKGNRNIKIILGDIRNIIDLPKKKFDIVISQRVIINLLNRQDQTLALNNIISKIKYGSFLIAIEAFKENLDLLNLARKEFGLKPIPPAHQNLYLNTDFFKNKKLTQLHWKGCPEHFLSVHYYISRVIHPILLGKNPFIRNNHFVLFMSELLGSNVIGNYSPLIFKAFQIK